MFWVFNSLLLAQTEIYATVSGGDLYSIQVKSCTRTFVGSTGHGFGDIAFTTNGKLWGIVSGDLYQIDTTNANSTYIGNTGLNGVSLVGVADTLLLTEDHQKLYGISTNSATSYLIGYVGYSAHGDLVFCDNSLYMVTPFVKIQVNSNYSEILDVKLINDAQLPLCEGAATNDDDYFSIIGFNGSNLVEICHLNGTYEIVCPDLNLGGTPGAASIPKESKNFQLVNVFTPNNDGVNDLFQPIGELSHLNSLQILNRWGDNIVVLNAPFIWDGHDNFGNEIETGVYFYTILHNEGCYKTIKKQSMIHLIR